MSVTDFPTRGVYFIRQGATGPVKIGYSRDVAVRIRNLQQGFPESGELLAVLPSLDAKPEKLLHRLLERDQIRGEWFAPTPFVMGVVAGIRALNEGTGPPEVPGVPFDDLPRSMILARKRSPSRGEL